jgi:uncharacterized protein YkwD
MNFTQPAHRRAREVSFTFSRRRFLFILWAVFFSAAFSYFMPPTDVGAGYSPVFRKFQVMGVATKRDTTSVEKRPAFLSQEIMAEKFVPTATPTPTPTPKKDWGKSRQIGEYTWTIDVSDDDRAGTADEVFQALNAYRQKNGKGTLAWSDSLGSYARSRADLFVSQSKTDSHAGFKDYLDNQDGFTKLGFMRIGENSSYGYKVLGVHLIEWVYAGDKPHDDNQLSDKWTHVGIGVNGLATDLIFAGGKM